MPKLSLIVPVYNVEQYLTEALQSIRAQTMTDFEVILVNDGSTDTSADIAAEICAEDARFSLVEQPNSGPGPGGGRNGGLAHAQGELLMFMDSDDVIRPSMFAEMTSLFDQPRNDTARNDTARNDMVTTSAQRLAGVTLRRSTIHDLSHPIFEASTTANASPWLMFDSTPWNKMFRREFFDANVGAWPAQQLYEDIVPMTRCLLTARSVGVLTTPHYLWRVRNDGSSITQQRTGIDGDLAQIAQLRQADRAVRARGTQTAKAWLDWKAYTFDFIWMLRKFAVLTTENAQTLLHALADAMNEIGTAVISLLTHPLQLCIKAVLDGDMTRIRRLAAQHRLALVPDRRRLDAAMREPALAAVMVSARPYRNGQTIVASSPEKAGAAMLELSCSPPWVDGLVDVSIAPTSTRRVGTRVRSTFDVVADDLPELTAGQPCFVQLRAGHASGELQRSVGDRLASRLGRGPVASEIFHVFEGTNMVLLTAPTKPTIDEMHVDGDTLSLQGELAESDLHDGARIADIAGSFDHQQTLHRVANRFTITIPLTTLATSIDYFVALTNSNNSGLPTPVYVAFDTLLKHQGERCISIRPGVNGQAGFRCNTNKFSAIVSETRARFHR